MLITWGLLYLCSCRSTINQDGHIYYREVMPDGVEIVYHSDECKCVSKLELQE